MLLKETVFPVYGNPCPGKDRITESNNTSGTSYKYPPELTTEGTLLKYEGSELKIKMEMQPNGGTILKLEKMCLRKCAVYLWNNSITFDKNSKCYQEEATEEDGGESIEDWQWRTELVLKRKVKELEDKSYISKTLGKEIIALIRPIGYQIKIFLDFQQFHIRHTDGITWPESTVIEWKSNLTVNYSETAKNVIEYGCLSDIQCYLLACVNCLEDLIPSFWHKLLEEKKLSLVRPGWSGPFTLTLEKLWPFIIHNKVRNLDSLWEQSNRHYTSFYQWAFEYFSRIGFLVPTQYFYKKMTEQQKEESVLRAAEDLLTNNEDIEEVGFRPILIYYFGKEIESETFCWLYTEMNPQQRRTVFYNHTTEVLSKFLFFPWPDFFVENVDLVWDIIPSNNYPRLISTFASRLGSNSNHYFIDFIQKCFVQSPLVFRKSLVAEKDIQLGARYILLCLSEDSESLQIFLNCLEYEDRKSLLLQDDVIDLFIIYILNDDFYFVKECLLTVELSKDERMQFEQAFNTCFERQYYYNEYYKFEKLFNFLKFDS